MLSKSKTTKALLYSTAALSLFAASHVHADETSHWTARSVDQIKADISVNDNQQTYTVQYGDTLGSIAEAMGIDMNVLANIKEITKESSFCRNPFLEPGVSDPAGGSCDRRGD